MPISRREFESGEPDPSLLLTELLRSDPDCAYAVEELMDELASRGMDLTAEEVQSILGSLEDRGKVESKVRYGMVYYICSKRIGFRSS